MIETPAAAAETRQSPSPASPEEAAENLLALRVGGEGLDSAPVSTHAWLWEGYLAPGDITLLTSQWKSGKTTLVSVLLAKMAAGGELAGLRVHPGRAAIVSEESLENWKASCRKLHMGQHLSFFCRPFRTKPTPVEWEGLMQAMITLRRREGLDLVVIDPLAAFLPGDNENTASVVLRSLQPLRDLTAVGLSVLLLHHPRKGAAALGQAARGSSALPSHVDILLEMHWNQNPQNEDRRRRLHAFSRHDETRRHAVIELAADGTDYTMTALLPGMETTETWDALFLVLGDANEPLTQKKIRQAWPDDFARPDRSTIVRLLGRGLDENRIRRKGTGRKNDPYRYWMPEVEDRFNPGPIATPEQNARYHLYWQKKLWEASGLDSSHFTLEQFLAKDEPDPEPEPAPAAQEPTPEPEPAVAAKEEVIVPPEPESEPEPKPRHALPARPAMPQSPPAAGRRSRRRQGAAQIKALAGVRE